MLQNKDELYKALETVSTGYSRGAVSVDLLIRACERYKESVSFVDDIDYQILVSKSLIDQLNGNESDAEVEKAITPGQTKVLDGIMYVYSATAPGSKTPYAWHVVKKGAKTGKSIGYGGSVTDTDKLQTKVNEMFPNDLSTLKVVNANIGGSTGAKLVEDVRGVKYIKKHNPKNSGHVKSEYLTNQLYDLLGVRVPDYELYDENGEAVLLSRYIPMCKRASMKDHAELAKGFMVDTLLANWDVYENDNCLVDPAGRVFRVDNGGALNYRAQGGPKPFDEDVEQTFRGMCKHNPDIFSKLSTSDIKNQIADIKKKKDEIVAFLEESGQPVLADIMKKRIANLDKIVALQEGSQEVEKIKIKPRKLKSEKEMYRTLSKKELDAIWQAAEGSSPYNKLMKTGKNGWQILNAICELRGFNARPQVVTEAEYWNLIGKDDSRHFFRGISKDRDGKMSLNEMAAAMLHSDDCYYGTTGVYGQGIYAAHEEGKKVTQANYKADFAFNKAREYALQNRGARGKGDKFDGVILHGLIHPDADIVEYDDVRREIRNIVVVQKDNAKEIGKLKKELNAITQKLQKLDNDIQNFDKNVEQQVYKQMNYDSAAYADMLTTIDSTDWDAVDAFGQMAIPSWDDFVVGKMSDWVKSQGGTATKGNGAMSFTLPNSNTPLTIAKSQYDEPDAIKKKSSMHPGWNYAARKFQDWIESEHVSAVQEKVVEAKKEADKHIQSLINEKNALKSEYLTKETLLNGAQKLDPNKELMAALKDCSGYDEMLGVYAAIKGYDAIKANYRGKQQYYIILNRSKLIVSNKVDNV